MRNSSQIQKLYTPLKIVMLKKQLLPLKLEHYFWISTIAIRADRRLMTYPQNGMFRKLHFQIQVKGEIFIFFKNLFLVVGYLLHNTVLVSAIHQHESAIGIHVSPPSWTSLPPATQSHSSRLWEPWLSALNYSTHSHWLSVLHSSAHVSTLLSPLVPHCPSSLHPPPGP